MDNLARKAPRRKVRTGMTLVYGHKAGETSKTLSITRAYKIAEAVETYVSRNKDALLERVLSPLPKEIAVLSVRQLGPRFFQGVLRLSDGEDGSKLRKKFVDFDVHLNRLNAVLEFILGKETDKITR